MIMIARRNGLAYGTLFEGCESWNTQDNRPEKLSHPQMRRYVL